MLKLLALILLIILFFRAIGFVFRLMLGGFSSNRFDNSSSYDNPGKKKPRDGNVNIDYVPNSKQKKSNKDFRGGEYVDYEELD